MTIYRIHPGIGMARVGDSPTDFYICPETAGGLPIDVDPETGQAKTEDGHEKTTKAFKDSQCRIKRQAARFKIFVYDGENPEGRELQKGETIYGPGSSGPLVNIEWTVYLANKKAVWYQFQELQGEHGYAPSHPLRNADVTDEEARQMLIIDPGPQTVYDQGSDGKPTCAQFQQGANPSYAQNFPPPLEPNSIDTLGEIRTDGDLHLLVLGGFGNSGSSKTGQGHPRIEHFANNDGWYDDVSDGPVQAKLIYQDAEDEMLRYAEVEEPAWVIVGQPSYVPELQNIITLDDLVYDVAVRDFAYDTCLYGPGPYDEGKIDPNDLNRWQLAEKHYNLNYYPWFFRDIWPILKRPQSMQWVTTLLGRSSEPHNTGPRGNFDLCAISVPPYHGQPEKECERNEAKRQFIFQSLRPPGLENRFQFVGDPNNPLVNAPLMPLLSGDNPLSNTLPSKFLRLTDTQFFLLKQWAEGKFINECRQGWIEGGCQKVTGYGAKDCQQPPANYYNPPPTTGAELDRGVLTNALGGAFCPGGEVGWILRNPAIYSAPYRINANRAYVPGLETSLVSTTPGVEIYERPALNQLNPISDGLEPGDITKYNALPWQGDFNECTTQPINVTYEEWNLTYPEDPNTQATNETLWWPAHRPLQVQVLTENPQDPKKPGPATFMQWARGIPETNAGNLKMATAWKDLGFVINFPSPAAPENYLEVERNDQALGGPVTYGGCTPAKKD